MLKKIGAGIIAFQLIAAVHAYAYEQVQLEPFADIPDKDWAAENIYTLSAMGIIDGYPDGAYHPEETLSREAFIKLLASTANVDVDAAAEAGTGPTDVAKDRWSYGYIAAAVQHHWIDFMLSGSGEFMPEQPITREEAAAALAKLLAERAGAPAAEWMAEAWRRQAAEQAFPDGSQINPSLAPFLYYAVNRGLMEGDGSGFHPRQQLSRREAAALINRLIDVSSADRRLELTGFYAIQSSPALNRVEALDTVVMGWSHLEYNAPGTAKLDTETSEYKVPDGFESVVQTADQAKVRKELMIYSGDGGKLAAFLNDGPAQSMFLDQLAAKLNDSRFGFDGVCLDLEGLVNSEDAPKFLKFMGEVKAAIGGKHLTAAVPTDYHYKGYDLKGIGETADSVILMAYNFTHDESRLPSAPLPLVSDSIRRALQSIPADKLVLGISKEANQWITADNHTTMYKPGIDKVEKRAADSGSALTWSLPYFLERIHYQEGNSVSDIYYEDAQSIAKKMWLAKAYGLKGVSLWYMGNFTPADWERIVQK